MMNKITKKIFKILAVSVLVFSIIIPNSFSMDQQGGGEKKIENSKVNKGESKESQFASDASSTVAACIAGEAAASIKAASQAYMVQSIDFANLGTNMSKLFKDCLLDGLANVLKRKVVRSVVKSTVDWINGGFEGKPAYAVNIAKALRDTRQELLDDIIYNNTNLGFLCNEFEFPLKAALNLNFSKKRFEEFNYTPKCTIGGVKKNIENSLAEAGAHYSKVDNFFNITRRQEDIYSTYFNTANEIRRIEEERNKKREKELDRGDGFYAFRDCKTKGKKNNFGVHSEYDCEISVPGKTIYSELTKATGAELQELINADEFDEILGAVLGQLFQKILFSSGGIRGFSDSSQSGSSLGSQYIKESLKADKENIEKYKKQVLDSSYDPRIPKIMLNTLSSLLKTLQNARSILEKSNTCWESKKENYQAKNSDSSYIILTENTIKNNKEFIKNNLDFINSKISETKNNIIRVEENTLKYNQISKKLKDTENIIEIQKILNEESNESVKFINDISLFIKQKAILENKLDSIVNGKTVYGRSGAVKKGGANVSFAYCSRFINKINSGTKSGNSELLSSLTNTNNISFVDEYDAITVLENLKTNIVDINYSEKNIDHKENSDSNHFSMLVGEDKLIDYRFLTSDQKGLVNLLDKRKSAYKANCIKTYKKGNDLIVYNSSKLNRLVCKNTQEKRKIKTTGERRDYSVLERSEGKGPCNNDLVFDLETRNMKFAQYTEGCSN